MDAAGCRTLREILENRAEKTPGKPYVIFDDTHGEIARYSYVDFDQSVNRTARMLRSFGVRSGDKINLHLSNCVEFLQLWFGAS